MMNLFVFCFGLFFFLRWWVWLTGYPNIKMGSKSQHCQTWYMKVVGTAFPSAWTSRACRGVRERQMGENAFLCSLWMSPAERPQFQAVCPLDMLSGAESVPGRTGSRCPSSCQTLPQPAEAPALPPPFRTRAYPQASEKPAC